MKNIRYELRVEPEGDVEVNQQTGQKLIELLAGHMKFSYPEVEAFEAALVEGGRLVILVGKYPEADPSMN